MKYLNPSTVFIATGPSEGLLTEDLDPSSIALTVQIVDTVTGAPVHRQIHKVLRRIWDKKWLSAHKSVFAVISKVSNGYYTIVLESWVFFVSDVQSYIHMMHDVAGIITKNGLSSR